MRPTVPVLLVISVLGASFMGCSATSSIVSGGSPGLPSEAISPGDDAEQGSSTTPSQVEDSDTVTFTGDGGAKLYLVHCQSCHGGEDGTGATSGTPLHNQTGHTWHHPDAQLRDWIMNGKLPFRLMPRFKDWLSEKEVDAILAYIKTWWTEDQRSGQADISQRYQEALDKQKQGR